METLLSISAYLLPQAVYDMHSEVAKIVNEHKELYDEDNLRDLTDAYIKQIKTSGDPGFTGTFCYYIT